jgi:hypothetical protein
MQDSRKMVGICMGAQRGQYGCRLDAKHQYDSSSVLVFKGMTGEFVEDYTMQIYCGRDDFLTVRK